jgi:hypothetical protein
MLAANEAALLEAGVYLPKTGRTAPTIAAQHNVAFELAQSYRFDPAGGTLNELTEEIAASDARLVCLSSEEFETLESNKGGMRRLKGALEGIGYRPHIVLYLRPQADYIESLYAELHRGGWTVTFADLFRSFITRGSFWDTRLNYDRLVDVFAEVFGAENMTVRAYGAAASADRLLGQFLDIVTGTHFDVHRLELPPRLNVTLAGSSIERLDPLQILRVALRFAPSNFVVWRRFGAYVAPVTMQRLSAEIQRVSARVNSATRRAALRARADQPSSN